MREKQLAEARREIDRAMDAYRQTENKFRPVIAGEITASALNDLRILVREQHRLHPEGDATSLNDEASRMRISRGQGVAINQTRVVEQMLGTFDKRYGNDYAKRIEQTVEELARQRDVMERVLAQALPDENAHLDVAPHLSPWQVVGPFEAKSHDEAFQKRYEPERKIDLTKVYGDLKWTEHPDWIDGQVHELPTKDNSATYLYRTIHVNSAQQLPMSFGSDDGIQVWLNGKSILAQKVDRSAAPDQDKITAPLQPGQNNLLIKITNGSSGSGFYFRADGVAVPKQLEGVKDPAQRLAAASKQMMRVLEQSMRTLRPMHRELEEKRGKARKEFDRRDRENHERIETLVQVAKRRADRLRKLADDPKIAENPDRLAQELERDRTDAQALFDHGFPEVIALLRSHAAIEEVRPDADHRFIADAGAAARTLQALLDTHNVQRDAPESAALLSERITAIRQAFRTLEVVHGVSQIQSASVELDERERWRGSNPATMTHHPALWTYTEGETEPSSREILAARLSTEAGELLKQIPHKDDGRQVRDEMHRRLDRDDVDSAPVLRQLSGVRADITRVLELLEPEVNKARATLAEMAPTLAEMMRAAAKKAEELEQRAENLAKAATDQKPEQTKQEAAELQKQEQEIRRELTDITDALRRDANLQDTFSKDGRERSRDADDAVAMIREPANRAQEAIQEAVDSNRPMDQTRNLEETSRQEDKLAQTLEKLADHYDKLDKGEDVSDTRQAMRDAEQDLGIKSGLDDQYKQLERLAELAENSPEQQLAALEQELQQNRQMQRELDALTKDTLQQTQQDLERAAEQERAEQNKLAQNQQQQNQQAEQLGKQMQQLQSGIQELADKQVPDAAKSADEAKADAAKPSLQEAQKQAQNAKQQNPDAQKAPQQMAQKLQEQSNALKDAAKQLAQQPLIRPSKRLIPRRRRWKLRLSKRMPIRPISRLRLSRKMLIKPINKPRKNKPKLRNPSRKPRPRRKMPTRPTSRHRPHNRTRRKPPKPPSRIPTMPMRIGGFETSSGRRKLRLSRRMLTRPISKPRPNKLKLRNPNRKPRPRRKMPTRPTSRHRPHNRTRRKPCSRRRPSRKMHSRRNSRRRLPAPRLKPHSKKPNNSLNKLTRWHSRLKPWPSNNNRLLIRPQPGRTPSATTLNKPRRTSRVRHDTNSV